MADEHGLLEEHRPAFVCPCPAPSPKLIPERLGFADPRLGRQKTPSVSFWSLRLKRCRVKKTTGRGGGLLIRQSPLGGWSTEGESCLIRAFLSCDPSGGSVSDSASHPRFVGALEEAPPAIGRHTLISQDLIPPAAPHDSSWRCCTRSARQPISSRHPAHPKL